MSLSCRLSLLRLIWPTWPQPGAARQYLGALRQYLGASRRYPGASRRYSGASRQHLGASRQHLGASRRARLAALAALLLVAPAWAADLTAIRTLAQKQLDKVGNAQQTAPVIDTVRAAPMTGLYELVTKDRELYYTDEGVHFLIVGGNIIDLKTMSNLTAERMREVTAVRFDSLPLDLAIKQVKGNGKRQLAVFSDSDCPFCRRLENTLADVTDVTVYTFLFPITQLHPQALEHSRRIWCAPDRLKAWNDYWKSNTVPEAKAGCDTASLEEIQKLGRKLGVNATPTLVFGNGHLEPGAIPLAQIEKELGQR